MEQHSHIRTLEKDGDRHVLVVEQTLIDKLGIGSDTRLELTVIDGSLVVRPLGAGAGRDVIAASLAKIRQQPGYSEMLSNLAK